MSSCLLVTDTVIKMSHTGKQTSAGTATAGSLATKQPVSRAKSLLPAVKQQLQTALNDMKKSVVNLKKSPWMLSRSSLYLHRHHRSVEHAVDC